MSNRSKWFTFFQKHICVMTSRILLILLFPGFVYAQVFTKDRFISNNHNLLWSETVEIKDMDTPIIVETLLDVLRAKEYVQLVTIPLVLLTGGIFCYKTPKKLFFKIFWQILDNSGRYLLRRKRRRL